MRLEQLIGERFKERPTECAIDSHALMVRGGYIKYMANGIFTSYNVLCRITRKIEQIIREEMDAIGGQEVQFPVIMPASLWKETGRYESVGEKLARFTDRSGSQMVLGMTHEEAAVHLVRDYVQAYTKFPFMVYHIQTKFRDEVRSRGGLIRVREFTMGDGYSFHTSQQDLDQYYQQLYNAHKRVFARVGIPEVVSVASDSGMMGGNISHEFMLLTKVGEDSIAICQNCDYRANIEAAECLIVNERTNIEPLTLVHTPEMKTIEEVCGYLKLPPNRFCKAVIFQKDHNDEYIILFIRGDLEVNETKLQNYLGEEVHRPVAINKSELCLGFIGPYQLNGEFTMLFDQSLEESTNLYCGSNQINYLYSGLQISRDIGKVEYHDFAKIRDGDICPKCGKPEITISRGVEVGNIFQLGTKYTKAMNMRYIDENGDLQYPMMCCFGIGVGRLAASVCEARHDDHGPIWPMAIAPWQVHLCCLRADNVETKAVADDLYKQLQNHRVEVIYDDRFVTAGVIFSDADLLGVPIRIIVSPRNVKEERCEIVSRDKSISLKPKISEAVDTILGLIDNLS